MCSGDKLFKNTAMVVFIRNLSTAFVEVTIKEDLGKLTHKIQVGAEICEITCFFFFNRMVLLIIGTLHCGAREGCEEEQCTNVSQVEYVC